MSNILSIRRETEAEKAAREATELPISTYLVIESYPRSGCAVIRECDLPGMTRAEVLAALADGQWDNPEKVLFIDEQNGVCRNVSVEIANALRSYPGHVSNTALAFCDRVSRQMEAA